MTLRFLYLAFFATLRLLVGRRGDLVATDDSHVEAAGTATGIASAYGRIGEPPRLSIVT